MLHCAVPSFVRQNELELTDPWLSLLHSQYPQGGLSCELAHVDIISVSYRVHEEAATHGPESCRLPYRPWDKKHRGIRYRH